jgi:hypothetical protein
MKFDLIGQDAFENKKADMLVSVSINGLAGIAFHKND